LKKSQDKVAMPCDHTMMLLQRQLDNDQRPAWSYCCQHSRCLSLGYPPPQPYAMSCMVYVCMARPLTTPWQSTDVKHLGQACTLKFSVASGDVCRDT
jgi:hypothetical protein